MPTYKGVEVWIEDSERRKLDHQEVTINLVDDRTVTVKTEMPRDELYTVHCLCPISVFCDVFVIPASRLRKRRAARFFLDKSLAISQNASGSSANHTEGEFQDHGLRTPKQQSEHGKLGNVEVEIRRVGEITEGEPPEENELDGDGEVDTEFTMIDDFSQPPWLNFNFEISVKGSLLHHTVKNPTQVTSGSQSETHSIIGSGIEASREAGDKCFYNPRKRPREHNDCDVPTSIGENPIGTRLDQLQKEYQAEEAEEQRLLHKLQERLQTKRIRNMELRKLLGETP